MALGKYAAVLLNSSKYLAGKKQTPTLGLSGKWKSEELLQLLAANALTTEPQQQNTTQFH